ncbi:hemin ABC transporter substrate-binding protein [Deefgea tanakiae]|uniref:Hemin ABC transporter substrate-binding protein n=1 Tax=Deefgea tanakiae TaxID=2865840 RepID=A0ABX8ZA62_9NEIS|nr:hemin ABC transporter substrate-binding protein [Deefgea tanakiae]QZA78008.1 hemin ABC transporter substrate-binding protein [Deefgea tanakiae]
MRTFYSITTIMVLYCLSAFTAVAFAAEMRVVSLGGPLTEIVYALNAGNRLVAVDQSSVYPAAANQLPKVGYYRQFSVEGVLSAKPDLILASDQAGPPEALEQLRRMGRRVVVLPSGPTMPDLEKRIYGVAAALGLRDDGRKMVADLQKQVGVLAQKPNQTRALMLMSRTGAPEGAGKNTSADAMMNLAGMSNVLAKQQGYKPLSQESLAALRPDVIITTTRSVESLGGIDKMLASPGLSQSPAAKQKRVLVMDDLLLLGFGPRLPEALTELKQLVRK